MATVTEVPEIAEEKVLGTANKLRQEHLLDFIEPFEEENSHYFEPEAGSGESHKLFLREVHQKYQELFKSQLEAWLSQQGLEVDVFLAGVKKYEQKLPRFQKGIATQLLAASSFDAFEKMMIEHNELLAAEMHYDSITNHRAY